MRRELRALAREVFIVFRHAQAVLALRLRPPAPPLRLNLGSFRDVREGWLNVDPYVLRAGTIGLDLRRPLPFRDGSAESIHAEHFLEHLDGEDARRLLRECYRVLRSGGRLSLSVPDAGECLLAYARGDVSIQHVHFIVAGNGFHLEAYDEGRLRSLLAEAGFDRLERRDFDPALDLEMRREGSLRMTAYKS